MLFSFINRRLFFFNACMIRSLLGAISDSLGTNRERCFRFWQMRGIHNLAHSDFTPAFAHRQSSGRGMRHDMATDWFLRISIEHGGTIDLTYEMRVSSQTTGGCDGLQSKPAQPLDWLQQQQLQTHLPDGGGTS
jgi:hypothetical protein